MSGNNSGASTLQMLTKHTSISTIDLGQYDIIILQTLEDNIAAGSIWTFSQGETDALEKWVRAGGALIAISGYGANTTEVQPLNQLLGGSNNWSGLSYNADDIFGTCSSNMCYCADGSIGFDGWQTDYADFDQLTRDLKKVGVFHGHSINCAGSDCQVFAKDASGNKVGVAKKIGNGRIFAWSDEFVTYTSQWGVQPSKWDTNVQCTGGSYTAKLSYSVPQLWYNAVRWLIPGNTCLGHL
jgi:hypothetical protein